MQTNVTYADRDHYVLEIYLTVQEARVMEAYIDDLNWISGEGHQQQLTILNALQAITRNEECNSKT